MCCKTLSCLFVLTISFSPPHSSWKILGSIIFKFSAINGLKSIHARISLSKSTPGAISINLNLPSTTSNTALSVTYKTGIPALDAYSPLNVICSTLLIIFYLFHGFQSLFDYFQIFLLIRP